MDAHRIIGNMFAMASRNGQMVTCQHEQRLGLNNDGSAQYGTPTAFEAMWLPERVRVRDVNGEQIDANGTLWVPAQYMMLEQDRITLPDGSQVTIVQLNSSATTTGFPFLQVLY